MSLTTDGPARGCCFAVCIFAWQGLFFPFSRATADSSLTCNPAIQGTAGLGNGLYLLPGGAPLSTFGLAEVQGSVCGLGFGASSARGRFDYDQRVFASFTYTLGYGDISGGLAASETKDSLDSEARRVPQSSSTPTQIFSRDRFFISTRLHPTSYSELGIEWSRDLSNRDSIAQVDGLARFCTFGQAELYGYARYKRVDEDHPSWRFGGEIATAGLRVRRKWVNNFIAFLDVGAARASGPDLDKSRDKASFLLGFEYRRGYHDSSEIGHLEIRDH
jgi:hypothetical protein